MRSWGIWRLRHWIRRAWLATQPKAVILVYHRVAELSSDPQLLSVMPRHFAEHLEHVCRYYYPMSLAEFGRVLVAKRIPRRAVVITFDDGYGDNLWNAKPLLEKYDVPATVFVTTGYVGQDREFWDDELERFLLSSEKLPERLELEINGQLYEWNLHESLQQGTWSGRWDVTMEICPNPRCEVYKNLHHLLRPLEDEKQQQALTELAEWARISRDVRPRYRALESKELERLEENKLVEIGSHTITHPVLSALSPDMQRKEIVQSKSYLEEILDHPVVSFSYQYGGKDDVAVDTVQMVREAGYRVACANFHAPVTRNSDPYWLPRFLVRDWSGDEFAKHLRRFFRSYD